MKPQGLGGFNYCMTIIDAATMYTWVIFLVLKGDAGQKLHEFIRWLQNQSGRSVKVIMRDGGKEYSPTKSKRFAKKIGIDVRESLPMLISTPCTPLRLHLPFCQTSSCRNTVGSRISLSFSCAGTETSMPCLFGCRHWGQSFHA